MTAKAKSRPRSKKWGGRRKGSGRPKEPNAREQQIVSFPRGTTAKLKRVARHEGDRNACALLRRWTLARLATHPALRRKPKAA